MNTDTPDTVPCKVCELPTPFLGTQLCDSCWGLQHRLESCTPERLIKIMAAMEYAKGEEMFVVTPNDHGAHTFLMNRLALLDNAAKDHPGRKLIEAVDTDFASGQMTYRVEVGR